jgi:hypothetical protein
LERVTAEVSVIPVLDQRAVLDVDGFRAKLLDRDRCEPHRPREGRIKGGRREPVGREQLFEVN